jgi:membrane protein
MPRRSLPAPLMRATPLQLLIQTGLKWYRDDCAAMAAAVSFHALFSLFPMLLLLLGIFGAVMGPDTEALRQGEAIAVQFLPKDVYVLLKSTIAALNQSSVGAGIIGSGLLLYSASTVFNVLSDAVNKIWRSYRLKRPAQSMRRTVLRFVLKKFSAFIFLCGGSVLLLTSLITSIVIRIVLRVLTTIESTIPLPIAIDEIGLANGLQLMASLLLLTIAISILFKLLPSTTVGWRDVWLGGLLTALLVVGLQQLVSNSVIAIGSYFISYGVIGSSMILLLWIYLTSQLFLLGCTFTYVYAHLYGTRRHQGLPQDRSQQKRQPKQRRQKRSGSV